MQFAFLVLWDAQVTRRSTINTHSLKPELIATAAKVVQQFREGAQIVTDPDPKGVPFTIQLTFETYGVRFVVGLPGYGSHIYRILTPDKDRKFQEAVIVGAQGGGWASHLRHITPPRQFNDETFLRSQLDQLPAQELITAAANVVLEARPVLFRVAPTGTQQQAAGSALMHCAIYLAAALLREEDFSSPHASSLL